MGYYFENYSSFMTFVTEMSGWELSLANGIQIASIFFAKRQELSINEDI